jgi:hypothetical protein
MNDDIEPDDEIIACWCGAKGTYDELFDDACLDQSCGGTGYVECSCGGDQRRVSLAWFLRPL